LLITRGHTIAILHLDDHLWLFDSKDDLRHSSLQVYSDAESKSDSESESDSESKRDDFMNHLEAKYRLTTAPEIGIYGIDRTDDEEEEEEASEGGRENPY